MRKEQKSHTLKEEEKRKKGKERNSINVNNKSIDEIKKKIMNRK